MTTLKVVEFYSGIGGWSHALTQLQSEYLLSYKFEVVGAFDINPVANEVYRHNCKIFVPDVERVGSTKRSRRGFNMEKSIDQLTPVDLDSLSADLWVMSPPCQPHTRNNRTAKRDTADPRSDSFINLIKCLQEVQNPPQYIALENVIGFEEDALIQRNYSFRQFDLTPTQFGIPNERPRYYCIATIYGADIKASASKEGSEILKAIPNVPIVEVNPLDSFISKSLSKEQLQELEVPLSVLTKSASWCFDVRSPSDVSSACFTKAYGKFIRGTGSILEMDCPDDYSTESVGEKQIFPDVQTAWWAKIIVDPQGELDGSPKESSVRKKFLRYFSPDELLALFGFDTLTFQFPPALGISDRKKYELIGNSLNVRVVKELLKLLLTKYVI